MKQTYTYRANIVKVIDGDTIDLSVDLGFNVRTAIRTRLMGINAPEVNTLEGKAVREFLRGLLPIGEAVMVTTFKDPTDKFGRWLAVIEHMGANVNDYLLQIGMAVPFMEMK